MTSRKSTLFAIIALTSIFAGCESHNLTITWDNHPKDWTLASYDEQHGYVFVKGGVTYLTHCTGFFSAKAIQTLPPGFVIDVSKDSSYNEALCTEILPYLHKVIPLKQGGPFPANALIFAKSADGSFKEGALEFLIAEAK